MNNPKFHYIIEENGLFASEIKVIQYDAVLNCAIYLIEFPSGYTEWTAKIYDKKDLPDDIEISYWCKMGV